MIPVKVKEVVLDHIHNPLLLLVDTDETIVLPIGIGFWEAQAIILKLRGHVTLADDARSAWLFMQTPGCHC